jgi:exopolysaccharide production protein ExoQ
MSCILRFLERGFTVASLIIYSGGFLSLIKSGGASEGEAELLAETDSTLVLIVFQLIYVVTFVLLVLRWKKVFFVLKADKIIWILLGFAVASILWSIDPVITFVRCVALIGTSLFGLYLATRYSLEEQLQILALTFGVVIALSFISILLLPQYGIMAAAHAGAWRGIYNHKNVLGKMMVLSSLIFLMQTSVSKRRMLSWAGLSLSIVLLVFAKSSAAYVSFLVLAVVFLIFKILRWQYELMIPALLVVLMSGGSLLLLLTEHADKLLKLAGKDPTLTGRTDFWILVLNNIWKHPWLGYGYGSFWQDSNSDAALIRYAVGWGVPNAHNGLLDLGLDLGVLGLVILLISLFGTIIQALVLLRKTKSSVYIWPLLFIANMVFANLTETTLMVRNDVFWVIYIALALSLQIPPEDALKDFNRTTV